MTKPDPLADQKLQAIRALLDVKPNQGEGGYGADMTWWDWIEDGLGGTLHDDLKAILDTPDGALF